MARFVWLLLLMPLVAAGQGEEADQFYPLSGDYAASHILVAWRGAAKAKPKVRRSKAEAKALAGQYCAMLAADPSRFETLAREHSDGVTARAAGYLGGFPKGRMDRPFEQALRNLAVGQITSQPVRTSFGYHIIRRESLMVKRYAARIILLSHADAAEPRGLKDQVPNRLKREAGDLASQLRRELTGDNFYSVATRKSDLKNVFMGVVREGDGEFTDRVIDLLKEMNYGRITDPLDWDIGYVMLQRVKVERRNGSRIFIGHYDSEQASVEITRNREDALVLTNQVFEVLRQDPSAFEKMAKKHSDDPGAANGGKMAAWYVGYQDMAVETAFAKLAPGQISKPIETPDGFYIMRNDAPE